MTFKDLYDLYEPVRYQLTHTAFQIKHQFKTSLVTFQLLYEVKVLCLPLQQTLLTVSTILASDKGLQPSNVDYLAKQTLITNKVS